MSEQRLIRIIKDLLPLLTGSAGIVIQGLTHTWNPYALIVCGMLLGIPVKNNLSALMPSGDDDTQLSSSQSPQRSPRGRSGQRSQQRQRNSVGRGGNATED